MARTEPALIVATFVPAAVETVAAVRTGDGLRRMWLFPADVVALLR